MTNLDHGKFTGVTTFFHTLLALDVFLLFFTGYGIMFNDELWWLVDLAGGNRGVVAVHRIAGLALIALTIFWITLMIISPAGRGNFREIIPSVDDIVAMVQDVKFALGLVDERHPNARQFAGYTADETPVLTYIGKGVLWIFSIELTLLMISGLLIWSKPSLMTFFQTKPSAIAFVLFHGLLGVIMFMGVMFHIFEHGFHPAFYPVELKAFISKEDSPSYHSDDDEEHDGTGIELLTLAPSWGIVTTLAGLVVVIGIASILVGSIVTYNFPLPLDLTPGRGPTNTLLAIGINMGVLVLFSGVVMIVYGNFLGQRWKQQVREEEEEERRHTATDGGESSD